MAGRTETDEASTIRALARSVAAAGPETLSAADLHQAQLLLLDTIGCGLAGDGEEVAESVARLAIELGGAPQCPLIGRPQKTGLLNAVLANGVAIRVLDLNDYLIRESNGEPETGGHPSDNIPVALAVGTARARSGAEILSAIAIGYDVYARLQRLMDRSSPWDSVTASGIAAPAIAGRLMGLDETTLAHALALGAARAATPTIVRTGHISAAKSVANALVAQAGVQAALLAEKGLTAPLAILDDTRGLRGLFAQGDATSALSAANFRDGAILMAHIKAFPCVNTAQSAVAAALLLHSQIGGKTGGISRIEAIMADYAVIKRHQEDPGRIRPLSREAADHSFSFLIAVTLIDGVFGVAQFENERWLDPKVTELMARIALRRDSTWNARAPGAYPCTIRLWDQDGREHAAEVPYPPGFSAGGLDERAVIEKFHAVAGPVLRRVDREEIVDAVLEFQYAQSTTRLDAAISKEGKTE